MRMTGAILPGSPSLGNIKRLCNSPSISFRFLLTSSKDRPSDMRENILSLSLSLSLNPRLIPTGTNVECALSRWKVSLFSSRESTFNICSSASFRRPFLIYYFSLLNQMDLEASGWVLNSCTAIYNCPSIITHSTKENFVSSCHSSFPFENYQYFRQRLHYLFSFF